MHNELGERALSAFGAVMLALAAEAGVYKYTTISTRLVKEGLNTSGIVLSTWAHGEHAASRDLPDVFARAFNLTIEKKIRLAIAYSYGQTIPASEMRHLPEIHQVNLR